MTPTCCSSAPTATAGSSRWCWARPPSTCCATRHARYSSRASFSGFDSSMKQNIYDNPRFFEGYSQLRRHESGLNMAVDQPAMRSLLPPLANKRVLDLGCGFGKMCRYAIDQGAANVVGVDISTKMLAKAREDTADSRISYIQSALEDLTFAQASFDVVASSLALHYIERYDSVCANVKSWLVAGGAFVFSVEHPMVTAYPVGRYVDEKGEGQHWLVDNYKIEGIRHTQWFTDDVI